MKPPRMDLFYSDPLREQEMIHCPAEFQISDLSLKMHIGQRPLDCILALMKRGPMRLDSSRKAQDFFKKHIDQDVEEFWIVALNSGLGVIEKKLLFRGTANSCPIHPRDLIRFVCCHNAISFVIAHNHPSGDPRPSRHDIEITKRLFYLSQILEIPMNDHIILSKDHYFSFADNGLFLKFASLKSLRLRP